MIIENEKKLTLITNEKNAEI